MHSTSPCVDRQAIIKGRVHILLRCESEECHNYPVTQMVEFRLRRTVCRLNGEYKEPDGRRENFQVADRAI